MDWLLDLVLLNLLRSGLLALAGLLLGLLMASKHLVDVLLLLLVALDALVGGLGLVHV